MLDAALVGTGGMMPLHNRFLSSLLCRINGKLILIDCGEGTQVSLRLLGWGFKDIGHICFTHFHADHISGLPGLLLTIANAERTEPVHFFGPPGLENVVTCLCAIAPDLPFPLIFNEWKSPDLRYKNNDFIINALPVFHRAPCFAYNIIIERRGRFDLERAQKNNIPMQIWSKLQKQIGTDIVYNGRRFTSDMVLGPVRKGLKLSFCTDTRPVKALTAFVREADLFICEGLYGDEEKWRKTAAHKHMLFREAAEIARDASVKELWLTHFSPAMPEPQQYISAAAGIFPRTVIGRDRMVKTLRFTEGDE